MGTERNPLSGFAHPLIFFPLEKFTEKPDKTGVFFTGQPLWHWFLVSDSIRPLGEKSFPSGKVKGEEEFLFSTVCIWGDKRGQGAVCEGWRQVLVGMNRCLWTV